MPRNMVTISLPLFALLWAHASAAEMIYPLIIYKCDTDTDTAMVSNTLIKDGSAGSYNYSEANGTYSPWDLVEIDHASNKSTITKTSSLTRTCKLSAGEYTLIIEPQLFGRDLNGRCGASISAALTVSFDGIEILERTPFENFCHGNAPVITEVIISGKTSEVEIKRMPKHRFY